MRFHPNRRTGLTVARSGALFDGSTALGLSSGGSGDCSSGGETFFQPVPAALSALGASIG